MLARDLPISSRLSSYLFAAASIRRQVVYSARRREPRDVFPQFTHLPSGAHSYTVYAAGLKVLSDYYSQIPALCAVACPAAS